MVSPQIKSESANSIQKDIAVYELFDPSVYNNPKDPILKKKLQVQKRFTRDKKIGEGTYAVVYKGRDLKTGRLIAIKKIKPQPSQSGLDFSAIREIKALKEIKHPNVVELLEMISSDNTLSLILEFLESDLEQVIKDKSLQFSAADIKSWMLMTLKGLDHCHKNWILHRDLKPNNLLLAKDGQLKLADFGLARHFGDPEPMTPTVVTIWYRSLELLFGAKYYSTAIDMWSVGTIFAELMLRTAFLPGRSDFDQVQTIYNALGVPTEDDWPGMKLLPTYIGPSPDKQYFKTPLREIFKAGSDDALDLLSKLLMFDPNKRINTQDAIFHHYFTSLPRPTEPSKLPKVQPHNSSDDLNNNMKRENSGDTKLSPSTKVKKEN